MARSGWEASRRSARWTRRAQLGSPRGPRPPTRLPGDVGGPADSSDACLSLRRAVRHQQGHAAAPGLRRQLHVPPVPSELRRCHQRRGRSEQGSRIRHCTSSTSCSCASRSSSRTPTSSASPSSTGWQAAAARQTAQGCGVGLLHGPRAPSPFYRAAHARRAHRSHREERLGRRG